jgi:hypothetical protein
MSDLDTYYNEHATQARQHEDYRERMTNILLVIAGVLVGLVTYGELALWTLPASFTLILLGAFGFFFAGKHYERFKYHTSIMKEIRDAMDQLATSPGRPPQPLATIRSNGEKNHYQAFSWPMFGGSGSAHQAAAKSWIARQRLHNFWEVLPLLVAFLGVALAMAAVVKAAVRTEPEPMKVQLVK